MPTNTGLSVNDVVNVTVSLSVAAALQRNFGAVMIAGDSAVIDTQTRYRTYTSLIGIGLDFGSSAPEYLAAVEFFAQSPQPSLCYIGRWARTSTSGVLTGATLSAAQQALSIFSVITNGGIDLVVDGTPHNLTGINLTAVTNLNGVASALQTALAGAATCFWDSNNLRFVVTSATSGTGSSVALATAGSGTDLSVLLGLNASNSGAYSVGGILAETPLACAQALAALTSIWYGLSFAASIMPQDSDYIAVSNFIQAASPARIFGITTQEGSTLTASPSCLAAQISNSRTFIQYSSSSPYAALAAFGIAFTVDFEGVSTLYTLKFKQESAVTAETLTETSATNLNTLNCNVFVNYNDGVAILQQGVMSNGTFFDVIHGTDWFQNDLQTAVFNEFLQNNKIAQTDSGVNQIVTSLSNECEQAVTNGLLAPGIWDGNAIGAIVNGQYLAKGYYIYAPPVSSQSAAARAARQTPVITICGKLAGAFHFANITANIVS